MRVDLLRRLVAEGLGSAALVVAIVGSGLMATGLMLDAGMALLVNTLATAAMLAVLITALGPISGAHLNPVVSMVAVLAGDLRPREAAAYVAAQALGAISGIVLAHAMFARPLLSTGTTLRAGGPVLLSEAVATFGLVATILCLARVRPSFLAAGVALYIASAYWFTASTGFANPSVTLARALTDSAAGIRPADVTAFWGAQVAGGLAAAGVVGWLMRRQSPDPVNREAS